MARAARRPREAVAFRANVGHVRSTAWIAGPGAMVFLAYSAMTISTIGRVAGVAASALCALIAVHSIIASLDRRVLLSIGPEGLMYRYFSTRTITWPEITAVVCYRHAVASVYVSSLETVCFSVANLDDFPRGPLRSVSRYLQRVLGRPPITIQPWFTEATSEQIVEAIRTHWGGRVDVLVLGASAPSPRSH